MRPIAQHCPVCNPAIQELNFLQRSFHCRLQKYLRILAWITIAEHGVARHQNFCASPNHVSDGVKGHAAIYFDAVVESPLAANLR